MIEIDCLNGSARPLHGSLFPMTESEELIVNGTVDRQGRLVAADSRLLALQLGAGGEEGGILAIPQIAALARLARTLGVLVSRGVVAADGSRDLDLWVRAKPEGETVELEIAGWEELAPQAPGASLYHARAMDFASLESDGNWACDEELRLTELDPGLISLAGLGESEVFGQPLTRFFRLAEDDEGNFPLLAAVARRQEFALQLAELRTLPNARLWLHGMVTVSGEGRFTGFTGGYRLIERSLAPSRMDFPARPAVDEGFSQQIGRAHV